jgi:hypothetical protein
MVNVSQTVLRAPTCRVECVTNAQGTASHAAQTHCAPIVYQVTTSTSLLTPMAKLSASLNALVDSSEKARIVTNAKHSVSRA